MTDRTLAAMMDDLGLNRQNELPMDDNPKQDKYPRRPARQFRLPGVQASSGWGALASTGLDDQEAEVSRALGDLGGGRLYAAADASMNALFNSVHRLAYGRPSTQRPNAGAARTTGLGGLERPGVPVRRFGTHPNTQTSLPTPQLNPMPQMNRGPPPLAIPRSSGVPTAAPAPAKPSIVPPTASVRPTAVPVSTPAPVARMASQATAAHQKITREHNTPLARTGATWSPPRSVQSEAKPLPQAPVAARADLDPVPVAPIQPAQNKVMQEQLQEMHQNQEPELATVPPGGSITILKFIGLCQILAQPHAATQSPGTLIMKLVQKGEAIVGSILFKYDNGTSIKFKWSKMVAVDLDIPKNALGIAFTFNDGTSGDQTFTVNVISTGQMQKLKDTLHAIHEILYLDDFMAGREDVVMKAVEGAALTFSNSPDSDFKMNIGQDITRLAAYDMAKNLGIPPEALTIRLRNILSASFVRLATEAFRKTDEERPTGTEAFRKTDEERPTGTEAAAEEVEHVGEVVISTTATSPDALGKEPAPDVAIKKETAANDLPTTTDGATPANVHEETVIDVVIKEETGSSVTHITAGNSVEAAMKNTTFVLAPHERPASEVGIKNEEADDDVSPSVDETSSDLVRFEESVADVEIKEEEEEAMDIVAPQTPAVSGYAASTGERTPAPHERAYSVTPEPASISVPASIPADTPAPVKTSVPDSKIQDELEEGELVGMGDGVEASFETVERRTKVTTMQTIRQGRLLRKIVTVEEYVYDDADVSSEL